MTVLLDYYVDDFVGDDYDFDNGFAFNPFGGLGVAKGEALDVGAVGAGGYGDGEAGLAVEGDSVVDGVFLDVFVVVSRPLTVKNGGVMAKGGMPQFFGYMGSEGHKDYQQLFED